MVRSSFIPQAFIEHHLCDWLIFCVSCNTDIRLIKAEPYRGLHSPLSVLPFSFLGSLTPVLASWYLPWLFPPPAMAPPDIHFLTQFQSLLKHHFVLRPHVNAVSGAIDLSPPVLCLHPTCPLCAFVLVSHASPGCELRDSRFIFSPASWPLSQHHFWHVISPP